MSLLSDIRSVADSLPVNELPTENEVAKTFGGLIKVLEAAGVTVAEELIPKPVEEAAAPIVEAAAPAAETELEKLVAAEVAKVLASQNTTAAPAAPAPAGPVSPPIEGAS